jgi:hypothetical protein
MWKRRWRARSRPNGELPATSVIPERSSLSLRRSCRRSRISICLKLFGCLAGRVRSFLSALRWASAGHSVVCAVAALLGCTDEYFARGCFAKSSVNLRSPHYRSCHDESHAQSERTHAGKTCKNSGRNNEDCVRVFLGHTSGLSCQ